MACLLAACGLMYACKDEFLLDDEKPDWLNSSIYQSLEEKGNFKTYLRLLDDEEVNRGNSRPLSDVLKQTGSKTVFVANDEEWEEFFRKNAGLPESNPWHYATSYENLSVSQKKLLIHTSMLNNAIVMENLASNEGGNNEPPSRGMYMRRNTDVEVSDTVMFLSPEELPYSYNENEKDYWQNYRGQSDKQSNGIFLVTDDTRSMMLHFTSEHMSKNKVTDDDFEKFMGTPRLTSDVHIYDSKLISKDEVCENGYVNVTDKPLVSLPSMAEVIRTSGRTNIFSHILDRFSAPFYSSELTYLYKRMYPDRFGDEDSIFVKRYFSENGSTNFKVKSFVEPSALGTLTDYNRYITPPSKDEIFGDEKNEDKTDINPYLKFDPGWNAYRDDSRTYQGDMAAMFVPDDETMMAYFTSGTGKRLIETYADPTADISTLDNLYKQIDQVPLGTMQALVRLIMFRSFTGSVPSKMTTLRDDAQEQMFLPSDIANIDTCMLASNGAVYIMKKVYGPADFNSVTGPAYISKDNRIIKWAIYDESKMNLNYFAYLKAMQSKFSFFLPSDSAMRYYYDPTSFKSSICSRVVSFAFNTTIPKTTCLSYNSKTGVIGRPLMGANNKMQDDETINRLRDILETHTIVHSGFGDLETECEDEYFLSKNGAPLKVIRENGKIVKVMGGLQLENERQGLGEVNPGVSGCTIKEKYDASNGWTYVLNAPLVPTYRSVYSILTNNKTLQDPTFEENNPYLQFFYLCNNVDQEIVRGCGLVDANLTQKEQNSAMKKFLIFTADDNGLDLNIQFFNNYRYTAFIPNNEAVLSAIEHGLPTWDEITEDYKQHLKKHWVEDLGEWEVTDSLETKEDSLRIQAKITYLTNFIRYHFADNSVFADKSAKSQDELVTSSYDKENGLFCKIYYDRVKEGDQTVLRVKDANEGSVMIPTIGERNVLARDVALSKKATGSMANITIQAASACVIHSIGGVLNHTELKDGNHNVVWETPEKAKRYLSRYAIR